MSCNFYAKGRKMGYNFIEILKMFSKRAKKSNHSVMECKKRISISYIYTREAICRTSKSDRIQYNFQSCNHTACINKFSSTNLEQLFLTPPSSTQSSICLLIKKREHSWFKRIMSTRSGISKRFRSISIKVYPYL